MKKPSIFKYLLIPTLVIPPICVVSSCGDISTTHKISSFSELKSCIEDKARQGVYDTQVIEIDQDIICSEPIYVMNDTTIVCSEDHSITRADNFLDDMFVVGEDENGNNPIITGEKAKLTFKTNNNAVLTIDGNKDNIVDEIYGCCLFVSNSSTVNINNNIVIQNFRKDTNNRILSKLVFKTTEAGGAAIQIISGTVNMYGGTIQNCLSSGEEKSEDKAYMGGAIINFAGFNMYGGTINNCSAARAGALYNYAIANLYNGEISECSASQYGGAIYLPNAQYANLFIGSTDETDQFILKNNSSQASGGAIYVQHQASLFAYNDVKFIQNQTQKNGGAINGFGTIILDSCEFSNNKAVESENGKGGAIFYYADETEKTTREMFVNNCSFTENNSTKSGGAISIGVNGDTEGPHVSIEHTSFSQNSSNIGGAIWAGSKSEVDILESAFNSNSATDKGGAIYSTDSTINILDSDNLCEFKQNNAPNGGAISIHTNSMLNIENGLFSENVATNYGGGIAIYSSSILTVSKATFYKNDAQGTKYGGGGIYIYGGNMVVTAINDNDVVFDSNTSTKYGSAIYLGAYTCDSSITGTTITLTNNVSSGGGTLYTTSTDEYSASVSLDKVIATNNTSSVNGGALYFYTKSIVNIKDAFLEKNIATQYGGGIYASGAAQISFDHIEAYENSGSKGGFLYITTSGTTLIIKSGVAKSNIATSGEGNGACIWGNTKLATVKIKGFSAGEQEFFQYDGDISGASGFEVIDYEE